jgi:hypothetical protein
VTTSIAKKGHARAALRIVAAGSLGVSAARLVPSLPSEKVPGA